MPKCNTQPRRRPTGPPSLSAGDGGSGVPSGRSDLRMRFRRAVPWMSAVVLLCGTARADEPQAAGPPPPSRQQVANWLADLDANSRRVRETAERKLVESGPSVLPLLPPVDDIPSAAAREAVSRIIAAIGKERSRQSLQGTSVTLRGRHTLAELAGEIFRQTGNRVTVEDAVASRHVEVELDAVSFWQALEKIARAAELTWRIESGAVVFEPAANAPSAASKMATTVAGPFRLEARIAEQKPIVGSPGESLLRFEVTLLAEPHLKPLFLAFAAEGIKAGADAAGTKRAQAIRPFNPRARQEIPFDGNGRASMRLDYRLERDRAPSAVSLSGQVTAEVATNRERFAFDDVIEHPRQVRQQGNLTVGLRRTELMQRGEQSSLEVRCSVKYERGGPAFESHRTWVFHNDARVELSDGTTREHAGTFETILQADGVIELVYRFNNLPPEPGKLRFVYVAPTVVSRVSVPVELPEISVGER